MGDTDEDGGSGMTAGGMGDVVGRVLHGSYRITRLIGEGGMGVVYEATHVRLAKKRFAVKMLLPSVLAIPNVYARFRREAEITTELGHPHIVDVLDFNETDEGLPYMVMEYLEGEDLSQRLARCLRLPPIDVMQAVEQTAGALQAAHDLEIVHRDLKPENIFLVGPRGGPIRVKVLDFGISKIRHSTQSMVTKEHSVLGTPSFMSPEQAQGEVGDIDHTTDIFALGAITYHALSGELPFAAPTIPGVLYKVCHADPIPVSQLVPALSSAVDEVLTRAMAKAKADRYQRMEAFSHELKAAFVAPHPAARRADSDESDGPSAQRPTKPLRPTPASAAPAPPTIAAVAEPPTPRPLPGSPSVTTLSGAAGESLVQAPPRRLPRQLLIGGAALVAVAAIVVIATALRSDPNPIAPKPSALAAPPSSAHPPDLGPPAVPSSADSRALASAQPRPKTARETVVGRGGEKKASTGKTAVPTPRPPGDAPEGARPAKKPDENTAQQAPKLEHKAPPPPKAPIRKGPLFDDLDERKPEPKKKKKKPLFNDL